MIRKKVSKSGRIILTEDGWSIPLGVYVPGAQTYKISLCPDYARAVAVYNNKELAAFARNLLLQHDEVVLNRDELIVLQRGKIQ